MASTTDNRKHIVVTGATDGIGLALVKQLVKDYGCKVYLGARTESKGIKVVEEVKAYLQENNSGNNDNITDDAVELLMIDVSSESSIASAAETIKSKNLPNKLYALVNNAGIGLQSPDAGKNAKMIIDTNYYGAKRVTEAFINLDLIQTDGRIVMTGSGAGPMTVRNMPRTLQEQFVNPTATILQEELESKLDEYVQAYDGMGGYGISKAMLHAYATALSKEYGDKYRCYSLSPGFIATKLTSGYGAKLTPEQGTVSLRYCLFDATKEQNGWYFGSDAKRSPVHKTRDPGDPEYDGSF